jgi:hypothetical protein
MYSLPDGSYSVDIEQAPFKEGNTVEEHRILSRDLKPKAFTMELPAPSWPGRKSTKISCEFGETELHCAVDRVLHGGSTFGMIQQKKPYTFMPVFESSVDLTWFLQMSVSQAERLPGHLTIVPIVTFEEGDTRDSLKLGVEETEQIEYLGQEKIEILGQQILAHKFRIEDKKNPGDPASTQIYWTSEFGLLVEAADEDGPFLVLSAYDGPTL